MPSRPKSMTSVERTICRDSGRKFAQSIASFHLVGDAQAQLRGVLSNDAFSQSQGRTVASRGCTQL